MNTRLFFVVVSCLVLISSVQASPIINVGTFNLFPDTVTTIAINVSGGDSVGGLNFYIQVGDGGSVNGGTDTKPIITDVDIVGPGTIFSDNNDGYSPILISADLMWGRSTLTNSGTVIANGVLGYVTIDTTGTAVGESYNLLMGGVAENIFGFGGVNTDFLEGVTANITNGTINIVPEPATLTLLTAAGIGALLRRRR